MTNPRAFGEQAGIVHEAGLGSTVPKLGLPGSPLKVIEVQKL